MLYRLYGGKIAFDPDLLEPISKKQILKRMLNNLKIIYLRQNDLIKGLSIVDRLMVLDPASGEDITGSRVDLFAARMLQASAARDLERLSSSCAACRRRDAE